MKQKPTFRSTTMLLVLGITTVCLGQKISVDRNRMNRDIRIMEGILDKLFDGKSYWRFTQGNTQGMYLEGFGVAFHANKERPVQSYVFPILEEDLSKLREEKERIQEEVMEIYDRHEALQEEMEQARIKARTARKRDKLYTLPASEDEAEWDSLYVSPEETLEDEKKAIQDLKDNILVFFQNYASAIGQLRPDDRIAVLVNLDDWEITRTGNAFLIGWIAWQDVERYRRKQMSKSDFEKNIHFQLTDSETDIHTDIDIMTEILHRAMAPFPFRGTHVNNGLHLDGLGAIFFIDFPGRFIHSDDEHLMVVTGKDVEGDVTYYSYGYKTEKEEKEEEQERKDYIQDVRDDILEILASYGHTLRLDPNESIIFSIDTGRSSFYWNRAKDHPSQLILQMKKAYLDDYNRGTLSFDELQKKLILNTF